MNNLIAQASIHVKAGPDKVWGALTNPDMITKYLFGTRAESDWKEGSPLTYKGSWEGKEYEDKGTVLKSIPGKLLETTYWSSMAGKEDKPENYARVRYEIAEEGDGCRLSIIQDNNQDERSREHSEASWKTVLEKLKALLETGKVPQ